jgi:hypothetical protein
MLSPFYELTKKDKKFEWTEEYQERFDLIKQKWGDRLELSIPDNNKKYVLETDASDTGLGAVLKQEGKAIACISRALKGPERNYIITE